jgi:hypothetical protein
MEPINPGGPIVEITFKNVSDEPVTSLVAKLEMYRSYEFTFNVDPSNPLPPGESISCREMLIQGAFNSDYWYTLSIDVTLQDGESLSYTRQIQIVEPAEGPRLLSPTDRAVLPNGHSDWSDSPEWHFDWEDLPGATQYDLYVAYSTAVDPLVDDDDLTESSYTMAFKGNLSRHYGWIWKVRAKVAGVWTEWSETRTFDVEFIEEE